MSGVWGVTPAYATCASGYVAAMSGATPICRAELPSSEFFYGALDAAIPMDRYPICGADRVPVTGDGSYLTSNMASSGVPRSSLVTNFSGENYSYLKSTNPEPVYAYQDLTRCACVGKTYSENPAQAAHAMLGTLTGGLPRILPDTADVISTQSSSGGASYGMVAMAHQPGADGRAGILFGTGQSQCACPNFNEVPESLDPGAPTSEVVGVRCVPAVAAAHRVLTQFVPSVHDAAGAKNQIMNRGLEPVIAGGSALVAQVALPRSAADQVSTDVVARKIWTCARPYKLNVVSGACEFIANQHSCSSGDEALGIPPSEVTPSITGGSKVEQFLNAQNKKLGACITEFGSLTSPAKFDCIDNTISSYSDFNALWASSDPEVDGGQINAIQFTNSAGKLLTGFYELSGSRCDQFNELVDEIQPGKLIKQGSSWSFQAKGSPLPRPSLGLPDFQHMVQKLNEQGLVVPSTPDQKARCPILVRAAALYQCPSNPLPPGVPRTYDILDGSGGLLQRRCPVASTVQVQFRIEQVFEMEGVPPLMTVDTFQSKTQVVGISVAQINAGRYGPSCPPGTSSMGDACVYQ